MSIPASNSCTCPLIIAWIFSVTSGILDVEISSADKNVVWVTIASYEEGKKVYRTDDGGETWINISKNLPNIKILSIVEQIGTEKGVYVGTEMGIFYTDETMDSWVDFSKNLPNVFVSELEIQYEAGKIRAATFGRGVWESNLYNPTSIKDNPTIMKGAGGISGKAATNKSKNPANRTAPGLAKICAPRSPLRVARSLEATLVTTIPAHIDIKIAGI